ncbi:MAG TPA: branched-chain amino acid ABC transporter ATP-binding protein/permease [Sporichthyaceae bacterium]|jgi:ABC-type branched-subunit amino acid transport system ATPase component/ABC-type branched-subunit amino acid transport system permease subunit|nr:branched-chain amino acid ABC transporter ATP-binding protein/permease [Sporichthyaceae bacterium]
MSIELDRKLTFGRHRGASDSEPESSDFRQALATADESTETELDTSHNPHTRSRPLLSLLRQPLNVVGALIAIFWIFAAKDYWVFTISSGLIIGIVVLGVMVMTGWCREVNLASAGVYATTLYLASYVYRTQPNGWGLPMVVAVAVAIAVGALIMLCVSVLAVRFSGVYVMVFTLGLQEMIEKVMFTRYKLTGGDTALDNPRPVFFGYDMEGHDRPFYLFLLGVVALVLAFLCRLRFSPQGRAMMLTGADQQAAAAVGINPWKAKALGFAISGGLGGLGGILAAMLYVSAPTTVNYQAVTSLLWLSIAILGGFDSMTAVLGVAVLFQAIPFWLEHYHVDYYLLSGLSLLVGVLLGNRGLGGRLQDLYRRARFGPAAKRRASRAATLTTSASVLSRSDGTIAVAEYGANAAVRQRALGVLEEWFPKRRTAEFALTAENIHISFGGVHALRGATIRVPTGSFTGLIGPNGAGKTTLFDVVSGLQRPDRGTVRIFGENVTGRRPWDRAAMGMTRTFQTTRVHKDLGVADNLMAGAGLRVKGNLAQFVIGDPRSWRQVRQAEEAAFAIAQLLNIDRYWDERVGELEFSARRRTELGRALLSGPQILLLDEPTSGLDPASSGSLISLVRQLQVDLGLTVLLVEHYVKAVLEGCDLVYVLAEGRILAEGAPSLVAADADVQEQYLGAGSEHSKVPWRERMRAEGRIPTGV